MKLATLQISGLIRQLGYDGDYRYFHVKDIHEQRYKILHVDDLRRPGIEITYAAPRLDDVAYWLREKYGVCICISPYIGGCRSYTYDIFLPDHFPKCQPYKRTIGIDYDTTLEKGIIKALDFVTTYELSKPKNRQSTEGAGVC